MADIQSTQTHPKFIWRFLPLGMSSHCVIATSEREARWQYPASCGMVFTGHRLSLGVNHA
ncbi:host cell division inhibitor Icd-like protein [Pectobacterium aroidearum]|uniref:host cell division inhibitor Icd-like protein n=1 Tax=Pectobacterium TaxID=122277 RepID=UPI0015F60472|nr:host cell division inhibitor Icd-like protein [Pectobacterium aroidearum]MBA5602971.1 host cell division inhibitor Icd-like protein [Pectobacterium aroidearum]